MNVLVELTGAIDALCAAEPAHLADRQSIQDLHRQLERLNAATTRATAHPKQARRWWVSSESSVIDSILTRSAPPRDSSPEPDLVAGARLTEDETLRQVGRRDPMARDNSTDPKPGRMP